MWEIIVEPGRPQMT